MPSPPLIARVFWLLMVAEAVASAGLVVWVTLAHNAPATSSVTWAIYLLPLLLVCLGAAAEFTRSRAVMAGGIVFLVLPFIPIAIGGAGGIFAGTSAPETPGDLRFVSPMERTMAQAIERQDAAAAEQIVASAPSPGVLAGERLLRLAIVRAHSAAGRRIVTLLVDQGADLNVRNAAGQPVWWEVLADNTAEGLETLALLLGRGADPGARDAEGGAVSWAAYQKNWAAVKALIDSGVPWRGEQRFGAAVDTLFRYDYDAHRARRRITPEMAALAPLLL